MRSFSILKKQTVLVGLATALSLTDSAIAYPITIKLSADAEWIAEGSGVVLSTNKGFVHIYNENMYTLGDSKKNECYILEADTEDYVTLHENKYPSLESLESQREVSSWTKINCETEKMTISESEISIPDLTNLEDWKLEVDSYEYMADSFDKIVAENHKYFVVYQNAGTSCAAGNHWLFNKEYKSYKPVTAGTCDDRNFKVILNTDQLVFMSGNKVTALYPVY